MLGDLLHEVLLVDDFSDKPDLGDKLETYIKRFRGKVRNNFLSRNMLVSVSFSLFKFIHKKHGSLSLWTIQFVSAFHLILGVRKIWTNDL